MKFKMIFATCLLALPLIAQAKEITITNHTKSVGTASFNGTCSSIAGDKGVLKPGNTATIPQFVLDMFCIGTSCEAKVFLTNNCRGEAIATAKISAKNGVLSVANLNEAKYNFTYTSDNVTIDQLK